MCVCVDENKNILYVIDGAVFRSSVELPIEVVLNEQVGSLISTRRASAWNRSFFFTKRMSPIWI